MIPSRSPASTVKVTPRTAVSPPKRLVTPSSLSTGPPAPPAGPEPGQPLGGEAHDQDQHRAVDDEVHPGEAGLDAGEGGPQVGLEDGDEDGAQEGPEGGAGAADDGVKGEPDGEVHREHVEGVH